MGKFQDILTEELTKLDEYVTDKERAVEIRKVLKKHFPKTKFSVTSKGSINIKYTDGPALILVEDMVKNYESIDRDVATGEILSGGNTFVFVKRMISDKAKEEVKNFIKKEFDNIEGMNKYEIETGINANVMFTLKTMDLDKPIKFIKNDRGHMHSMFLGNMGKDSNVKKLLRYGG